MDTVTLPAEREPLLTSDIGQAIIKTLDFDRLEFIDDSDENNLRVVTDSGVFRVSIVREA